MRKLFYFLFGSLNWTLPPWLQFFVNLLVKGKNWLGAHKRIVWGTVAAAVLATGGYIWYESLPKPVTVDISGTSPSLTPLVEDPVYDSIYINFSASAANLEQVGKPITAGISMAPALEGEWRWNSDTQLVFKPTKDWGVGQEYNVKLDKSLFPDHVILTDYEYTFNSTGFVASLTNSRFHQDPVDANIKRVVATVSFTHVVNKEGFERHVSLRYASMIKGKLRIEDKKMPFKVTYNKFAGEAYITSEPIGIPLKDKQVIITIEPGIGAAAGGDEYDEKLTASVQIPGMYNYFRISSARLSLARNERNEPEQVMVIETTAGVLEKELQKNLEVYLLPRHMPSVQGRRAIKNIRRWDVRKIGPEVLAKSRKMKVTPIPTEHEYSSLHSFKYKADVGKHVYIRLKKGIKSYGGYILAKEYDTAVKVPAYPRELNIQSKGAILSIGGGKKVGIVSRGIKAIQFEVGQVMPGHINHLISQSGGDFSNPGFNNYNFSQDNITERYTEVKKLKSLPASKAQYSSFDFSPYMQTDNSTKEKRGLFFFKVQSWDLKRKRATGTADKRLILVTDLGMLVKDNADKTHDVFVQSLSTGRPVADVNVDILGKNGVAVYSATTDNDGRVSFPSFVGLKREKTPTVYIARKGRDVSFVPYDRHDRRLNMSRFDVGGIVSGGEQKKLDAYLFSDRGIYRPGDTFNIGMIIKSGDWQSELEGIPLESLVTDSRGLTVMRNKFRLSASGFEELNYQTRETSPTGQYQIKLYLLKDKRRRSLLGSTTVKVEEFLPDRMKIAARFSAERLAGWVSPEGLKARITLKNLYGTPATDRRVAASITLNPATAAFSKHRDYRFYDPMRAKRSFEQRLPDGKTDDKGEAEFELGLERFAKATYRIKLSAEGYEAEGGRGVSAERSVLVSPLAYLIGFKADGELRYIKKDSQRSVKLMAVNPELESMAVNGLQAQLIEQRYVSVLTRQNDGTYKYQSVRKESTLYKKPLKISARTSNYKLPTDKAGDFILLIRDGNDTELNRVAFSVVGQANLTRDLEKNAELQIKLNKSDYAAGEEIELQIKAPYTGAGLITIERDKVYAYKWFSTSTTSSVQRIRVPEDIEGNAYVNVSFVRGLDSDEIFMSPLSYGVMPFTISRAERMNKVILDVTELARPGEPLKIGYKSQHPGKIVVFAVNEGILQVADYKTPDPLGHFFKKRALEVKTSQILDMLLPEFELQQLMSAPGGGMAAEAMAALGKNLNPFKRKRQLPVVYWSGIIDSDEKMRELTYNVPDYFSGRLRVMAVVVSDQTIGVEQKSTTVRGHFVISPNVPTFVAPGDEFTVSVNLANNIEGSPDNSKISLSLKTSEHVKVLDGNKRELKISEGREKSSRFKVKASNKLGSGNFTFVAEYKDKRSRFSVDLSVRPPVPYMTTVSGGYLKDKKVDIAVPRQMYPHFRELEATASTVPLGMSRGLISYLGKYPYMCTEQLVSRAMPAIVLQHRPEFGISNNKAQSSLAKILRILRARQNSEGAFGFWAANSHVSNFQSVYAMHFLTEAKQGGYPVPSDLHKKGLSYLRKLAAKDAQTLFAVRDRAYALYILTRNGIVTTRDLNSLRTHLDKVSTLKWKKDLAGIYLAATYKLLKLDKQAEKLIGESKFGDAQQTDYRFFYDGLVRDAQLLYILSEHFPERLPDIEGSDMMKIVERVNRGRFNTLSSSFTVLAMDSYVSAVGEPDETKIKLSEILKDKSINELLMPKGLFPTVAFSDKAEAVRIDSDSEHNLFYQVIQSGFDLELPKKGVKQQLEVQREYRDSKGNVVNSVKLGEELEVVIRVRALDKTQYNVAVIDLLPGGFEAVLSKDIRNQNANSSNRSSWKPQHVDIREDRVILFGRVGTKMQEFVYRIKATNRGEYAVPPVYGESMYDRSVLARSLGNKVTVSGP